MMSKKSKWETFKVGYAPTWFKVRSSWRVLDIGSGHNPHLRADVLLDKYATDSTERSGVPVKKIVGKPLVVGDAQDMPFKDGEFDFIIASHIAEHVDDPKSFCEELMRVGKAGVIETPGKLGDQILSEVFHKWYVYEKDGVLIFEKIKRYGKFGIFGKIIYGLMYFNRDRVEHWTLRANNPILKKLFLKVAFLVGRFWRSRFFSRFAYTSFLWKGRFNYKIITG